MPDNVMNLNPLEQSLTEDQVGQVITDPLGANAAVAAATIHAGVGTVLIDIPATGTTAVTLPPLGNTAGDQLLIEVRKKDGASGTVTLVDAGDHWGTLGLSVSATVPKLWFILNCLKFWTAFTQAYS